MRFMQLFGWRAPDDKEPVTTFHGKVMTFRGKAHIVRESGDDGNGLEIYCNNPNEGHCLTPRADYTAEEICKNCERRYPGIFFVERRVK